MSHACIPCARTTHLEAYRARSRRRIGSWNARLTVDGKQLSLGYFRSAEDAAVAYDAARVKYGLECGLKKPRASRRLERASFSDELRLVRLTAKKKDESNYGLAEDELNPTVKQELADFFTFLTVR
jgi:hypothetical protein